ncbi:MAG: aminoacyl-tRNA hydrolase, partial [Mesorhizobium sp.]
PVPTGDEDRPPPKPPKQQSHVRQARPQQPAAKLPESGPMAAMLKKLFSKE